MSVLRLAIAVVVTLVWAAVWTVAIVTGDYNGVGAVTPVMLGVVGFLFAKEWMNVRNGKDGAR